MLCREYKYNPSRTRITYMHKRWPHSPVNEWRINRKQKTKSFSRNLAGKNEQFMDARQIHFVWMKLTQWMIAVCRLLDVRQSVFLLLFNSTFTDGVYAPWYRTDMLRAINCHNCQFDNHIRFFACFSLTASNHRIRINFYKMPINGQ